MSGQGASKFLTLFLELHKLEQLRVTLIEVEGLDEYLVKAYCQTFKRVLPLKLVEQNAKNSVIQIQGSETLMFSERFQLVIQILRRQLFF